ncbi:MAG: alpha/beta hydrolase [Smithella sp.]|jgi:pimeloyl-ACP methyl ester carboxylesterase|nr:alpha/beta hydrolase [Smithellaceae bacterium]NLA41755.1 alpha/beta hydrolase [Smithella sp.]
MLKYFKVRENRIACWVNPDDFGAHAQSLVFLHGSGGNSGAWIEQYSILRKAYNIAAIDLPGHGQSEGSGERDISAYVLRLKEILDVLKLARPVLVGHSLGAAIALGFAVQYPRAISGIVAAGGGVTMPVNPDILNGFAGQPDLILDLMCKFSIAKENRPKLYNPLRQSLGQASVDVVAGDMLACSKFDLTGELPNIRVPVLALCGVEDKMTPPASSEKIAGGIAGAKCVLIEGAGHMSMLERPGAFNDALTAFCREIGSDPRP